MNNAISIHQNKYDYSNSSFINYKTKIDVICSIHGLFKVNPGDHVNNKSGCPKCAGCGKYENPLEYFIERAKLKHNNFYDYSKFEYKTAKTKSIIICPNHGEFTQHANNHLSGKGCPGCRSSKISKTRIGSNTDENIFEKLKIIHNNQYEYPEQPKLERSNNKWKIKIICPIHGLFEQLYINHYYRGNGCEKCGNNKLSKGEKHIEEFLIENKIEHIREKTFENCTNPKTNRKLPFDFYLPKQNLCLEFDGRQHFQENSYYKIGKKELDLIQLKDKIKENYCKNNKINLIRISYSEFHKINQILCSLI